MIIFPAHYVATTYPGYFWNLETQKLYSIKISGELRELKLTKPNRFNRLDVFKQGRLGGYRISYKGSRRWLYMSNLKKLTESNSIFPEAV